MKATSQNIALATAGWASTVSALINLQVRYSQNMIDVGNLDGFAATWQAAYATAGNLQGIVTDNSYQTDQGACQTDSAEDLTITVKMDGAWGIEGNATAANMRDAIIQTMWQSVDAIWNEYQYSVYEGCVGTTWQDSPAYTASAACGPLSNVSCADACSGVSTPTLVQCDTVTYASKLPSLLRVTAYEDGTLLADDLTVTFAATSNDVDDTGCGIEGVIASNLASYIPVIGSLFSQGIKFECESS